MSIAAILYRFVLGELPAEPERFNYVDAMRFYFATYSARRLACYSAMLILMFTLFELLRELLLGADKRKASAKW